MEASGGKSWWTRTRRRPRASGPRTACWTMRRRRSKSRTSRRACRSWNGPQKRRSHRDVKKGRMRGESTPTNPEARKTRFRDATGLVPNSKEWFEHWYRKIDQLIAGDDVDLRGMTLAVINAIIHGGMGGTTHDEVDQQ